jgi:hypothetical protein
MSKGTFSDFEDAMRAFESGVNPSTLASHFADSFVTAANLATYNNSDKTPDDLRTLQYTSQNSLGFVGYQFGEALLIDLGYYNANGTTIYQPWTSPSDPTNDWQGLFTGKDGITSLSLLETSRQESVILAEFGHNLNILDVGLGTHNLSEYLGETLHYIEKLQGGGTIDHTFTLTMTGVLAAGHLVGPYGVANFLLNGAVATDETGTSLLQYMYQFGGYDDLENLSDAGMKSALEVAFNGNTTMTLAENLWQKDFNHDGHIGNNVSPLISSISSFGIGITNGNGHLNAGKTVALTVSTSEAVTVAGGVPTLTLNDGGTATFDAAHSTSTALLFTYTTATGQNTNDLIVSSLNLNGAIIHDAAGFNIDLSGATNYNPAGILQIDTHTTPALLSPLQGWTTPEQQTEAVYVAFFARAGDSAGLNFWMGNLDTGQNIFDVALNFSKSAEAQNVYPFLQSPSTDSDPARVAFIQKIYQDLFNRASDSAGLTYWDSQLHQAQIDLANGVTGTDSHGVHLNAADYFSARIGNFIMNVIGGAQNSAAGQDITTIQNKVAVAAYFSDQLAFHNISYANNQPVTIDTQAHDLVTNTTSAAGSVATQKGVADSDIASDLANHIGTTVAVVGLTTVQDFQAAFSH